MATSGLKCTNPATAVSLDCGGKSQKFTFCPELIFYCLLLMARAESEKIVIAGLSRMHYLLQVNLQRHTRLIKTVEPGSRFLQSYECHLDTFKQHFVRLALTLASPDGPQRRVLSSLSP